MLLSSAYTMKMDLLLGEDQVSRKWTKTLRELNKKGWKVIHLCRTVESTMLYSTPKITQMLRMPPHPLLWSDLKASGQVRIHHNSTQKPLWSPMCMVSHSTLTTLLLLALNRENVLHTITTGDLTEAEKHWIKLEWTAQWMLSKIKASWKWKKTLHYIKTRALGPDYNCKSFRTPLLHKSREKQYIDFSMFCNIVNKLTFVNATLCIQCLLQSGLPHSPCRDLEPDPWAKKTLQRKLTFNRKKSLCRTITQHIWPVWPRFHI